MARRKEPIIPDSILDQLLAGSDAKTAFESNGLLDQLKKALAERALNAEMDHHLSGEGTAGNSRNGYGRKTVLTGSGSLELSIPRDRQSSFDPQLLAKYQRRFPGFDEKIVSMYARGMSTREIVGHVQELYGIDVSPDLISVVTDAVLDEVAAWQSRPLDAVYPLVFFDALRVKIRDESVVRNKAVHVALGVRADGTKEVLGLWVEQNEGAKFWLRVMNELKNRGIEDILLAVADGLKGFPEAIRATFPDALVQTCIVGSLKKLPNADSTPLSLIDGEGGMLGRKERDQLELFMTGSLRQLIPDDHILARVDRVLDLGWLREEIADLYCADNGRPGIDPGVALRLML